MNENTQRHRNNLWFLQTTLNQKGKEHATVLLEEQCSFAHILKWMQTNLQSQSDIFHKFEQYEKSVASQAKFVLTRCEIEQFRRKSLSLHAPLAMEYRGNPSVLSKKLIGIVGSRRPTYYGRLQAQKFARTLSQAGYGIISGGAIGIDAIANLYSLEGLQGGSISVIGNGIAKPYPASNFKLFKKLSSANNGLLLSEFSALEPAQKWNFPQRNGTIAELCDFLLVIEATETSGSLMTAQFAKACGKAIGAVPGSIDNPNTKGCHKLIQNGAHCIQTAEDVINCMQ